MTAEEAIAIITGAQVVVTNRDPDKFVAAIDRALIALRLEKQRDNPKPLTIEELKQMTTKLETASKTLQMIAKNYINRRDDNIMQVKKLTN